MKICPIVKMEQQKKMYGIIFISNILKCWKARYAGHGRGNNLSVYRYTTGEVTTGNTIFSPKVHHWITALG